MRIENQEHRFASEDSTPITIRATGCVVDVDIQAGGGSPLAASAVGGAATADEFDSELRRSGFVPLGATVLLSEPVPTGTSLAMPAAEVSMLVEKPTGKYVIAVVQDSPDAAPQWIMPEPEVLVRGGLESSAFDPDIDATGPKAKPVTEVRFRMPAPSSAGGPAPTGLLGGVRRRVRFFVVKINNEFKRRMRKIVDLRDFLVRKVDKKLLKAPEGLKRIRAEWVADETTNKLPKATAKQLKAMEGEPVLLLVHGIFSSIKGAFRKSAEPGGPLEELVEEYDGRVLGFDHYTVSADTMANAKLLIKSLPNRCKLRIVCHSRGAGVVRCLLEDEKLRKKMEAKGIEVDTVMFVAGACLGSPLANRSTANKFANVLAFLISKATGEILNQGAMASIFRLLLHGVQGLPGIAAMREDSPIIRNLNAAGTTHARRYVYFRANFDPANFILEGADEVLFDRAGFSDKANDVVVPYRGAGINADYLSEPGAVIKKIGKNFGTTSSPQPDVYHLNFFAQPEVRAGMLNYLQPG